MTKHNDQARALFEAYMHCREHPVIGWIDQHWFRRGDDPAGYANEYVQGAWVMWQACAQLATAGVAIPSTIRRWMMSVSLPDNEWGHRLAAARDELLAAAPHPVSGDFNPEHTLFNDIRGSMPVNEDDEPTRYIINEAQLQRIRALEFGQHPVSGDLIRFDFINADGNPDSKMITHDEMRERFTSLQRSVSGEQKPAAYLHQVVQGDGEPDEALSFEPDSFPFSEALGFRSIACEPLYKHAPAAQDVSGLVEMLDSMVRAYRSAIITGYDRITALGGQCDAVDYMLAAFPNYAKAKELVAAHRAQQGEQQP